MPKAPPSPLTPAERAKRYRDKKKREAAAAALVAESVDQVVRDAERDDAPADAPPPGPGTAGVMLTSVVKAIDAMKWIQPSDGALVAMAKLYALQIDELLADGPNATGKAASLGNLLKQILHELGGTPTVRLQHELRSMRLGAGAQPDGGDSDGSNSNSNSNDQRPPASGKQKAGATVTSIKRPPKRRNA